MADGARETSGMTQEEQGDALMRLVRTRDSTRWAPFWTPAKQAAGSHDPGQLGGLSYSTSPDIRLSDDSGTGQSVANVGTAIAAATVEQPAEPTRPAFWSRDPGSRLPGGVMPDVLLMPAFKDRHPVTFLILLETGNPPVHALSDPTGLTGQGIHRCSNI
jgi:hypothetical protein